MAETRPGRVTLYHIQGYLFQEGVVHWLLGPNLLIISFSSAACMNFHHYTYLYIVTNGDKL